MGKVAFSVSFADYFRHLGILASSMGFLVLACFLKGDYINTVLLPLLPLICAFAQATLLWLPPCSTKGFYRTVKGSYFPPKPRKRTTLTSTATTGPPKGSPTTYKLQHSNMSQFCPPTCSWVTHTTSMICYFTYPWECCHLCYFTTHCVGICRSTTTCFEETTLNPGNVSPTDSSLPQTSSMRCARGHSTSYWLDQYLGFWLVGWWMITTLPSTLRLTSMDILTSSSHLSSFSCGSRQWHTIRTNCCTRLSSPSWYTNTIIATTPQHRTAF